MKVSLIQPPSQNQPLKVPPLGLACLAAVLKTNNIDVKILDLNVENTPLDSFLSKENPDLVGVSAILTNACNAFNVTKKAKQVLPESFVVMGGAYPSMMGNRLLAKHNEVDAVVVGEAEYTLLSLVNQLQKNSPLDTADGVIFRKGSTIKTNPPPKPVTPLDLIPYPAREALKMDLYAENAGVIFTSRGCPQQCIFCSRPVFGRTWRANSPEHVLNEIDQLVEKYEVSTLSVLDDNFTVDLNRAEKILDGIISKNWDLNIYFWNGMRADHVTKHLLQKLKQAGCTAINYGVESVDPEVISFIKKGVTLEQIEHAIKLTREVGIQANAFLMMGNPKDTAKSADKLIDFVKRTKADGVHLSMATPILGTPFWDWAEKNGRWLDYDTEELLDWPIDDVAGAYPVFETADFTAKERTEAYVKARSFFEENGLII
jgi:anaerobic magnesium-protoporphyrin IX monomethyl ester cyclase